MRLCAFGGKMENNNFNNQNNQNNQNNNQNGNNNRNGQTILLFIFAAMFVLFIMSFINSRFTSSTTEEISYTKFIEMVENGEVESVEISTYQIDITPKENTSSEFPGVTVTYYTARVADENLLNRLRKYDVEVNGTIPSNTASIIYNILSFIIPIAIIWIILGFAMKRMGGGGLMGVGKSNAKVYVNKKTGVTFKDVAGQDEAKESLQEMVDFLKNPDKYKQIGAKLPKGALLVGPPGTGKTLLAKALAGEAGVPFFSLAGSDFVEMFVGVGASRVRDLFKEATKQSPAIIFIDEIDAIGKSRDSRYSGNDEREQTLNQLLSEMDGFDSSKAVIILAATNRPEILDKALLRPGRFDRRVIVEKPDLKGRLETLKVHSKDVLMDESVDLDEIALATSGAVGSDLANMINEAAINAVKHRRRYVNQQDLFEAVEVVIAGKEKKDRILGDEEKRIVAFHEVGHALVTALTKDAEPVQKITIVPRTMGALGYVMQVPEEEKYLMSKSELEARIKTFMAGRAAEEIVFDSVTTGAANDIEKATSLARAMVTQYGMSEKFGLMGLESVESKYLDRHASLNCGEATASEIDEEVKKILAEAYKEAKALLLENREILDEIAEYLYENETITGKEFMKIFRRLKGLPEPDEEEQEIKKTENKKTFSKKASKGDTSADGDEEKHSKVTIEREALLAELNTRDDQETEQEKRDRAIAAYEKASSFSREDLEKDIEEVDKDLEDRGSEYDAYLNFELPEEPEIRPQESKEPEIQPQEPEESENIQQQESEVPENPSSGTDEDISEVEEQNDETEEERLERLLNSKP